jgi:hypothetical protein
MHSYLNKGVSEFYVYIPNANHDMYSHLNKGIGIVVGDLKYGL